MIDQLDKAGAKKETEPGIFPIFRRPLSEIVDHRYGVPVIVHKLLQLISKDCKFLIQLHILIGIFC